MMFLNNILYEKIYNLNTTVIVDAYENYFRN